MTLDEASQILNVKKGALVEESELQQMLKVRAPASQTPTVRIGLFSRRHERARRAPLSAWEASGQLGWICWSLVERKAEEQLVVESDGTTADPRLLLPRQNFDHLFAANNPLTKEGKPHSSHYLQSKIVRAKERIEAEVMLAKGGKGEAAEAAAAESGKTPSEGP